MANKDSAWVLRVPFKVAPALRLKGETVEIVNDVTIRVRSGIGEYNEFVLEGLATVLEARSQFEALRLGVLAASIYIGGGVRIGRDLLEIDADPIPNVTGQAMVYPEGRSLSGFALDDGKVEFQPEKVLPRFMEGLRIGLTARKPIEAMLDPKVKLAGLLYSDTYFEVSPQARLIGFIGVLEVLKDQGPRSEAAADLLDRWSHELNLPVADEVESLRQSLRQLKSISIGQGIRSIVRRHLGAPSAREVTALYSLRSRLVHDGAIPDDIEVRAREAASLAARLLAAILSKGAR